MLAFWYSLVVLIKKFCFPFPAAIDLAIIMEGSGHTKLSDFKKIKEIVKSIYFNFPVSNNGTHVAVAVYAEEMQIIFSLNKHYDHHSMDLDLETASFMPGLINTGNALRKVKTNIFDVNPRKGVPKVLITIMTGQSNDNIQIPVSELKDSFVLMFALGLTASYSPQDLTRASGEPHSEYVLISETFPDAVSIGKKMTDKIKKGLLYLCFTFQLFFLFYKSGNFLVDAVFLFLR